MSPRTVASVASVAFVAFGAFGAVTVMACGPCPASRYHAAEPARDETVAFDWSEARLEAGCVRISGATYCYSEADLQTLRDPATACQTACDRLTRSQGTVTSCAYRADRAAVRCDRHIPEKPETCSCSVLDC